jgi:hypothetical protein
LQQQLLFKHNIFVLRIVNMTSREGNIGIDLREIVWEGLDWKLLAQGRDQWHAIMNLVMNLQVP